MLFVNLFVYGALTSPEAREQAFGRLVPYMSPDTLSGFKLDEGLPYPALSRKVSSMVHGGIVVIHENELILLDEYETEVYGRIFVRLMSGKEAWVYAKKESPENSIPMEEKVLYNVLRQVARNESITAAPDRDYITALITIGMIKDGWDRELTALGRSTLDQLENKLHPWGT